MLPTRRRLRDRQRRPQHGRQAADPLPRRHLAGARLLHVRRRAAAHRGPDADRLRDRGGAVPVRGDDRLHDRPPAGVPRRRPRARAGDAGRRGAAARARLPPVPALRLPGREGLPALPVLPAQAQGPVRHLRQAAGPRLEDLPVLRGRDPRRHAAAAAPPPPSPATSSRRRSSETGVAATSWRSQRAVRDPTLDTAPKEPTRWNGPSSSSSPTRSRAA